MGANQSSNEHHHFRQPDNDNVAGTVGGGTLPLTLLASSSYSSPSSSSFSSAAESASLAGQQRHSALLSASPRSPKDFSAGGKRKSISGSASSGNNNNKGASTVGSSSTKDQVTTPSDDTEDPHGMDHHIVGRNGPAATVQMARGLPTRSSILRGSFRRVKVLNNVPPPVIPEDKFNRLSNVSLGSGGSSGFGSGASSGSQESTSSSSSSSSSASTEFVSSSTLSSFGGPVNAAPQTPLSRNSNSPSVHFQLPPEKSASSEAAAARKARMNLRLNFIPGDNPPPGDASNNGHHHTGSSSYDNPYGTARFNQAHSPITSPLASPSFHPLASPSFHPGNDSVRLPQPNCESPAPAGYPGHQPALLRRSETIKSSTSSSPSAFFRLPHPLTTGDRDHVNNVVVLTTTGGHYSGSGDSMKSPTRSDYVELMCSTPNGNNHVQHHDSRHSRSSFSSFDGSNYSSSSFNNSSPNGSTHAAASFDVAAMFHAGMNDNEVLSAWLGSIGFTEYFPNFVHAGYDMATAARMTTEDLTAIGVTKPLHRKRIRAEIARLPTVDLNFGCDLPDTAEQLLQAIGLSDYLSVFVGQNCMTCDKITNLTWDDLGDMGITRLGHLKKLTLAIKYFRALRRQTATSMSMEDESKRFSTSSYMSQDSNVGSNLADDDKSSASRSSLSSPHRMAALYDKKALQQQPVLTTFQALPSPLKDHPVDVSWRPRSALGRHPSPLPRTPESEEIVLSWNGSSQKIDSPTVHLSDSLGSLANGHCTLPRRKSVKSGAAKSIAKMMAQVFRSDKGSSAPSSPNKDQTDSSSSVPDSPRASYAEVRLPPTPTFRPVPLASFGNTTTNRLPPTPQSPNRLSSPLNNNHHHHQHPNSNHAKPSANLTPASPDFNDASRFPPPPSPLLRDYPLDMEKTPTLARHQRTFVACEEVHKQQQQQLPSSQSHNKSMEPAPSVVRDCANSNPPPQQQQQSSSMMPFAQDNIGTIKQRTGRTVPSMSSLIFREPALNNGQSGGDHHHHPGTNEEVLDEITGMLASLSDELDVAMFQLENAAH